MVEKDLENDYQGCFYDIYPFKMSICILVNTFSMTNEMCNDFCELNEFNFYSTFAGNKCSCGNEFGYKTKQTNECFKTCSGNSSQICGGSFYASFKVYNSDISKIKMILNIKKIKKIFFRN